jgi:type IV pilus assembly protein PilA
VIPVVLIIAAIAIPNLLRAKMAANEASAVGSLRTIETAAITYSSEYGNGYPPLFDYMGGIGMGKPSCDNAQLLDSTLELGKKDGYVFTYIPPTDPGIPRFAPKTPKGCTLPGVASFELHADPITRGTTGQRSFYSDQTSVIRFNLDGPATYDSPPLN